MELISNSFFRYVGCECQTKQDPFSQNTGRICDQGSKVLGIGGQLIGPQIFRNSPNFKVFFNHDMILISMIYIIRSRFFFSGKCIQNKYGLNTDEVDFYSILGSQMCTCLGQNCIKNLVDPDTVNSNFRSDFKSRLSYFSYKIRVKSNSSIGKKILNAKHFKLQLNCSYWSILIYT